MVPMLVGVLGKSNVWFIYKMYLMSLTPNWFEGQGDTKMGQKYIINTINVTEILNRRGIKKFWNRDQIYNQIGVQLDKNQVVFILQKLI